MKRSPNPSTTEIRDAIKEADATPDQLPLAPVRPDNGLATREAAPLAPRVGAVDMPIGTVINLALERGSKPEDIEKLIAMHERMQANAARQQFHQAIAAFKASCPAIPRRTENSQFSVTRNGQKVNRKYAALEDIEATIRGPLGRHGLSFRWTGTSIDGGKISMACVVSHEGGHSESSSVVMSVDSKAGSSDQQKVGAAMTYAQRYSLIQALGLTTCDEDADGNAPGGSVDPITEAQAANIEHMLAETKSNVPLFLEWAGAASVAEIPAIRFGECMKALEAKRKKNGGGA